MADLTAEYINLGAVRDQLGKYAESLTEKVKAACLAVATQLQTNAQGYYDGYTEGSTVRVAEPEDISKGKTVGYSVSASGEPVLSEDGSYTSNTVVFEEFGSGSMAGDHPKAAEYGFYPGSWSENYGTGEYANSSEPKHWHYGGYKLYFIQPTQAMWKAAQAARSSLSDEMRKAFE